MTTNEQTATLTFGTWELLYDKLVEQAFQDAGCDGHDTLKRRVREFLPRFPDEVRLESSMLVLDVEWTKNTDQINSGIGGSDNQRTIRVTYPFRAVQGESVWVKYSANNDDDDDDRIPNDELDGIADVVVQADALPANWCRACQKSNPIGNAATCVEVPVVVRQTVPFCKFIEYFVPIRYDAGVKYGYWNAQWFKNQVKQLVSDSVGMWRRPEVVCVDGSAENFDLQELFVRQKSTNGDIVWSHVLENIQVSCNGRTRVGVTVLPESYLEELWEELQEAGCRPVAPSDLDAFQTAAIESPYF